MKRLPFLDPPQRRVRVMRLLTETQHSRLDRLADERPDTKVIGWVEDGPLIFYTLTGAVRRLTADGRLVNAGMA